MRMCSNTTIRLSLAGACMMAIISLTGCADEHVSVPAEPILIGLDKAQTITIAENVLSDLHFTIDKADVETGLVTTMPLSGAQFFEFWRKDNVGSYNAAEANLSSIRRIAQITLDPQNGQIRVQCDVLVQRLTLPEHRISSSSRAYQLFSESSSSLQSLKFSDYQEKGMVWVDLGNDGELAAEILRRIEEQIALRQKEQAS